MGYTIYHHLMARKIVFWSIKFGEAIYIYTWWHIPLSKWVITPVINGISRVNPLITGGITHLRFVGSSPPSTVVISFSSWLSLFSPLRILKKWVPLRRTYQRRKWPVPWDDGLWCHQVSRHVSTSGVVPLGITRIYPKQTQQVDNFTLVVRWNAEHEQNIAEWFLCSWGWRFSFQLCFKLSFHLYKHT